MQKRANKIHAKLTIPYITGTLLDVGCGDGNFIRLCKKNKINACGTELLKKYGYPRKYSKKFDTVTAFSVLEQTSNVKKTIEEIKKYAKHKIILITRMNNTQHELMFSPEFGLEQKKCINDTTKHWLLKPLLKQYNNQYHLVYTKTRPKNARRNE